MGLGNRRNKKVTFVNNRMVYNVFDHPNELKKYAKKGWHRYYLSYIPRTNQLVSVNINRKNSNYDCKLIGKYLGEHAATKIAYAKEPFGHKVNKTHSLSQNFSLNSSSEKESHPVLDDIGGILILILIIVMNVFVCLNH